MKIRSKVFAEEMANAMEKAGTHWLTERFGFAFGPMVAAKLSMRQGKIVQKQKKQKGKKSENKGKKRRWRGKDHRASAWVWRAFQRWRGFGACASNAEILARNSLLNALTARRRTARDVNKELAMKGLKTDDHRASA